MILADGFAPMLLIAVIVMVIAIAVALVAAIIVAALVAGAILLLVGLGIVSISVVIGFARRSTSAGFRALFLMSGTLAGIPVGILSVWITGQSLGHSFHWKIVGPIIAVLGAAAGYAMAICFNLTWTRVISRLNASASRGYRSEHPTIVSVVGSGKSTLTSAYSSAMRVLITAGPTREPIDAVRYIGNRSSGRMGTALATAALVTGHDVTLILGPVSIPMPPKARRIDVETAAQMYQAVLTEFPNHDLLIMAAAVADYRPKIVRTDKTPREGSLTIECEATEDIVAHAGRIKRPDQRIVGFSLELRGNVDRAREKRARKNLDLIVYNPTETMNSESVEATLLWRDGKTESLASLEKTEFANVLIARSMALFQT